MKKLLLAVSLGFTMFTAANAQCVINTSYTVPGYYPDTIQNLPFAYVGTPYGTDLQFKVKPDTVTQLGTFPILQIAIDSVVGMPAGFSYTPNPTSGVFPGGSNGCVWISGNPTSGQELGGPNNDGVYPITVFFTATVSVFTIPTDFPGTQPGYKIHIFPPNGLKEADLNKFSISQPMPNPASGRTDFQFNTLQGGEVEFTLYNVLGSEVKKEKIKADKGVNRYHLDVATLAPGVYVYALRQGSNVVTRRLTVTN